MKSLTEYCLPVAITKSSGFFNCNIDDLINWQNLVSNIPVSDNVIDFAVELVSKTRPKSDKASSAIKDWIDWGAGPRASQYLVLGAKAKAILEGRPAPEIDDIKAMAKPVLRHRLITNFNAEAEGLSTDDILMKLFDHQIISFLFFQLYLVSLQ